MFLYVGIDYRGYWKGMTIYNASLPVCQFTSLLVCQFTSLPVCNGTTRFFTLALIIEGTEKAWQYIRPVYQFASLPVCKFTSLPIGNGTARFFTLALIVDGTEKLSQFMRLLKSIYRKNACYDEQKCIFEHFRNVKLITNLFNFTINLKTFHSVHLFSTALYEWLFALFNWV
jgi:hypothetical protein